MLPARSADGLDPELRILLVEDDDGDAVLVRELLSDVDVPLQLHWVRTLAEALPLLAEVDCVLLDLNLPDADGLDGLTRLRAELDRLVVVVLTGHQDEQSGAAAVAAGAQDYLIKGRVSSASLARTIQYALQRRRVEDADSALLEQRLYQQENVRLERGLLPKPVVMSPSLSVTARYQPGGRRLLLGGDFYDAVEDSAGALHVIIGDVSGHGPDEAALGVALRIGWRTLILAGWPDEAMLPMLERLLLHERHHDAVFVSACLITVAPDRRSARMFLAGHSAPLLCRTSGSVALPQQGGPVLGVFPAAIWPGVTVPLPEGRWTVLLYTDGIIEGRRGPDNGVLGSAGLIGVIDSGEGPVAATDRVGWLDALIARVTELNGGPLTDDLAVVLVSAEGE